MVPKQGVAMPSCGGHDLLAGRRDVSSPDPGPGHETVRAQISAGWWAVSSLDPSQAQEVVAKNFYCHTL